MTFLKPFQTFSNDRKKQIKYVLTDIDDTLTVDGKLPAIAYNAMELLHNAGIKVVPITGRPAGWCDHFARMWPIDGLVGENGAFYFYYDNENRKMIRKFWRSDAQREEDKKELACLQEQILREVPGCMVSGDQSYREADLAIDFCEDVEPLPMNQVKKIVSIFEAAGAIAKISSIHVNGWFGNYDKLAMTRKLFKDIFQIDLGSSREEMLFSGDSPNDSPMFAFFPNSVGVANVLQFAGEIDSKPAWITGKEGGYGFAEMVDVLLDC